jgi:cell division protease FtsH
MRAGVMRARSGVRAGMATSAYVLEKNRRRLVVLGLLAVAVLFMVGARDVVEGLFGFFAYAPLLGIQLMFAVLFMIVQFGALFWFLSRPRKYVVTPDDPQLGLTFENYRGQPDLLEHARSTVRILQGVKEFELRGGEMPKGMLLSGSPGTGKTFLASCIAAEAGIPFIYVDASSLTSMFLGIDALIMNSLFRQARGYGRKYAAPGNRGACILFMDELDSIGYSRGGVQGGQQQVGMMAGGMFGGGRLGLNAMLNQMDSLGQLVEDRYSRKILRWLGLVRGPVPPKPVVFVIGATNRPEVLDPALTRPGRLDRTIVVHEPDADGRRDIVQHYLDLKAHDPEIPLELMVTDSIGWTPIMIKTIINEALIAAHDDGRSELTYKDWLNAADARTLGIKQPIRSWNREDRRDTAYHEAGHAVAARYLQPENRIAKATIIRRGHALGYVQPMPREERTSHNAKQLETTIMVALAGRAAEEVFFGAQRTGAASDLQAATMRALHYVAQFGMGPTKLVAPVAPPGSPPMPYNRAANELLDQLYDETQRLLKAKELALRALAEALIERDELIADELEWVFAGVEAAHPELAKPFERTIVQFRPFLGEREPESAEWTPPVQEPAIAASVAGSVRPGMPIAADVDSERSAPRRSPPRRRRNGGDGEPH